MNKIGVICVTENNKTIAKKILNIVLDVLIVILGIIVTLFYTIIDKNTNL